MAASGSLKTNLIDRISPVAHYPDTRPVKADTPSGSEDTRTALQYDIPGRDLAEATGTVASNPDRLATEGDTGRGRIDGHGAHYRQIRVRERQATLDLHAQ